MKKWALRMVVAWVLMGLVLQGQASAGYTWSGDPKPYEDNGGWFYDYVEAMRQNKVIVGTRHNNDYYIYPSDNASRSWYGAGLMEVFGDLEDTSARFYNTNWWFDGRRWFQPYANDMLAKALVPYNNGYFSDGDIRRDEAFAWVIRAAGLKPMADAMSDAEVNRILDDFSDRNRILAEYRKDVALAVKLGIVTGYPDGTLKPDRILLRSEAATVLCRSGTASVSVQPSFNPRKGESAVFRAKYLSYGTQPSWTFSFGYYEGSNWVEMRAMSGTGRPPEVLYEWDGRTDGVVQPARAYYGKLSVEARNPDGKWVTWNAVPARVVLDGRWLEASAVTPVVKPGFMVKMEFAPMGEVVRAYAVPDAGGGEWPAGQEDGRFTASVYLPVGTLVGPHEIKCCAVLRQTELGDEVFEVPVEILVVKSSEREVKKGVETEEDWEWFERWYTPPWRQR
ncbi:MAG: S-layer homology domain-containing protein [Anaerolineae bacterium]